MLDNAFATVCDGSAKFKEKKAAYLERKGKESVVWRGATSPLTEEARSQAGVELHTNHFLLN